MNKVWYVSVPNLIPLSNPIGVSESWSSSSKSRTFRSFTVIQRKIALETENPKETALRYKLNGFPLRHAVIEWNMLIEIEDILVKMKPALTEITGNTAYL